MNSRQRGEAMLYETARMTKELLLQLSREEIEEISNSHGFPEFVKFYDIFRNHTDPTIGMDNLTEFILRDPNKMEERELKYSAIAQEIASRLGYPR
jgi:hypothetical protein